MNAMQRLEFIRPIWIARWDSGQKMAKTSYSLGKLLGIFGIKSASNHATPLLVFSSLKIK